MIISESYDVAALFEVMNTQTMNRILGGLGGAPAINFGGNLTSLLTISKSFQIIRGECRRFKHRGREFVIKPPVVPNFNISLDSDYYAEKGVLLTEIDTGLRRQQNPSDPVCLPIFSTHLMFGGGLGSAAETIANIVSPWGDHIAPSGPVERLAIELRQLDELVAFVVEKRTAEKNRSGGKWSPAVICGDFNIDGANPSRYAEVRRRLGAIGMVDAWAEGPLKNEGSGQTARNDDGDGARQIDFSSVCIPRANATNSDYCDEDPSVASSSENVGRFDYVFIEEPHPSHKCHIDFSRLRRRQFKRNPPGAKQRFLSDHMGLETTLFVSL